jgi:hypothetical protein
MSNQKDNFTSVSAILTEIFFKLRKLFISFGVSKPPYTLILDKQTKYLTEKYSEDKGNK